MKLDDVWNQGINVEELPDEIHKELTVKKLANELIRMATYLDTSLDTNDIKTMKEVIENTKLRMVKLVASMLHLFEWMDVGDILYQTSMRALMEEYLLIQAQDSDCKSIGELVDIPVPMETIKRVDGEIRETKKKLCEEEVRTHEENNINFNEFNNNKKEKKEENKNKTKSSK